jgi:hypothetical protein
VGRTLYVQTSLHRRWQIASNCPYFPLEEGLQKVTWGNFRERIELALAEENQPFLVEFFEKDLV